ncbi:MAG: hypothetical protein ACRD21_23320, partial [Vicinamibacteria bacterium]
MERHEVPALILAFTFVASSDTGALGQEKSAPTDDRYLFVAGASEEQAVVLSRTPTGVQWNWVQA